jgi:hypothetical protein
MTYELGRWWLESGPYQAWECAKVAEFERLHVIEKLSAIDCHNGSYLLLAEGYPMEESSAAEIAEPSD